jgi:energy-coupling factor transporter ATP-binding protein EcfA2
MWPDPNRQPPREDAEPYGWWGFGWDVPDPLSVVDLIAAGNFDARTAALLWLLIEARASIVVAADPPGAGKTTTLTALSDFLPPELARIYLRGWNETFAFLATADPARSYLLCNEISAHLPVYLWGSKVRQLFAARGAGFAFGATMHADAPDEVIAILAGYPLSVPLPAIARLDLIMTLAVEYDARRPRRRLDRLVLLRRGGEGDDLDPVDLAWWDTAVDGVVGFAGVPPPGLLRRTGLDESAFAAEWARRGTFLADLAGQERRDRALVRRSIAEFRR